MNKDSKIFVAGHRGLVGSAILKSLQGKGYTNFVVRTHSELDLMDQRATEDFFAAELPEYVFQSAAMVGGIMANSLYRADFIYRNLMIQNNIIHNAWKYHVKKLLFLGSTCIYPREAPQPMPEDCLLTSPLEYTNEPYAIAKIAGIKMCESYNLQYGTNFMSVMPTNLYGPNDNFHLETSHVLPALIRKIHLGKCLEQNDWPLLRRDLNHRPIEGIDGTAPEEAILSKLRKFGIQRIESDTGTKPATERETTTSPAIGTKDATSPVNNDTGIKPATENYPATGATGTSPANGATDATSANTATSPVNNDTGTKSATENYSATGAIGTSPAAGRDLATEATGISPASGTTDTTSANTAMSPVNDNTGTKPVTENYPATGATGTSPAAGRGLAIEAIGTSPTNGTTDTTSANTAMSPVNDNTGTKPVTENYPATGAIGTSPANGRDITTDESNASPAAGRDITTGAYNTEVEIWGSGAPMREFLWSEDMADACVYIAENIDFKDIIAPWYPAGSQGATQPNGLPAGWHKQSPLPEIRNTHLNIGTGISISIKDIANLIKQKIGFTGTFRFNTTKPDGTLLKQCDLTKLHALGWRHKVELDDGVERLYRWYLDN